MISNKTKITLLINLALILEIAFGAVGGIFFILGLINSTMWKWVVAGICICILLGIDIGRRSSLSETMTTFILSVAMTELLPDNLCEFILGYMSGMFPPKSCPKELSDLLDRINKEENCPSIDDNDFE